MDNVTGFDITALTPEQELALSKQLKERAEARAAAFAKEAEPKLERINAIRKEVARLNTEAAEIRLWCRARGIAIPRGDDEAVSETNASPTVDKIQQKGKDKKKTA